MRVRRMRWVGWWQVREGVVVIARGRVKWLRPRVCTLVVWMMYFMRHG